MSIKDRESKVKSSRTFHNIRNIFNLSDKIVCDVGCGFGEYLRFFRSGSIGITTTKEEAEYAKKNGLDVVLANAEKIGDSFSDKTFDVIWANNLIEHLLSPHAFLVRLKRISRDDTISIIGVPVIPKITSLVFFKLFRGTLASNHINFFTETTLHFTIERAGWKIKEIRPFIFKNYFMDMCARPFAPHLYAVAHNDTSFSYAAKKISEWSGDDYYSDILKITKQI